MILLFELRGKPCRGNLVFFQFVQIGRLQVRAAMRMATTILQRRRIRSVTVIWHVRHGGPRIERVV